MRQLGISCQSGEVIHAVESVLAFNDSPSVELIAMYILEQKPCTCLDALGNAVQVLTYCLTNIGVSSCASVGKCQEYFDVERRFPTRAQLVEFIANEQRMANNPDEFFAVSAPPPVPTANLGHLPTCVIATEEGCSICQEPLVPLERAFEIPDCLHKFHMRPCLGGVDGILTWLEKNDTCPNCKIKIKIKVT